jgi:predicted enzyme related to lactoylglutathione lyase
MLSAMTALLRHFALNATDVDAARRFYSATFGWGFEPWGPPGFFHIRNGDDRVQGALQHRRELLPDGRMRGLEGTFGVDDLAATMKAALAAGGRVLTEPATIAGVGHLSWLVDPDANVIGAMQYDPEAR